MHKHIVLFVSIVLLGILPAMAQEVVNDNWIYSEQNGLVVMEAETASLVGDWVEETSYENYSGDSYVSWKGQDINFSAGKDVLSYRFKIAEAGIYRLSIRNQYSCEDITECNDVFTKIDDKDWIKTWSHTNKKWNWETGFDVDHVLNDAPSYRLEEGSHTFYIGGRSGGFSIDRIVLWKASIKEAIWQNASEASKVIIEKGLEKPSKSSGL